VLAYEVRSGLHSDTFVAVCVCACVRVCVGVRAAGTRMYAFYAFEPVCEGAYECWLIQRRQRRPYPYVS
jgi:hypothetical protein